MKILLIYFSLILSACSTVPFSSSNNSRKPADDLSSVVQPSVSLPSNYQLVWQDNFNSIKLNLSKWTPMTDVRDDAQQTDQAISTTDGYLRMTTYSSSGTNFTGFLSTQGHFATTYGFFEASIRFHDSPGEWCAFWLQSATTGNPVGNPRLAGVETDIAEHRVVAANGGDISNEAVMNLHWDGYGPDHKTIGYSEKGASTSSLQGNWHSYAVLWNSSGYTFYLDGQQTWQTSAAISSHQEFVRLTCEVRNNSWAGIVPNNGYGELNSSVTGMDVQWVRVWQ